MNSIIIDGMAFSCRFSSSPSGASIAKVRESPTWLWKVFLVSARSAADLRWRCWAGRCRPGPPCISRS